MKNKIKAFRKDILAAYYISRHRRTPLAAKIIAAIAVSYFLSPVDLIPDYVPILGHLDDIIILPLGIRLIFRLTPPEIIAESREKSEKLILKSKNYFAACVIIFIWILPILTLYFYFAK